MRKTKQLSCPNQKSDKVNFESLSLMKDVFLTPKTRQKCQHTVRAHPKAAAQKDKPAPKTEKICSPVLCVVFGGDSQERPERENGKESYVERQKERERGREMDVDGVKRGYRDRVNGLRAEDGGRGE